MNHRAFQYTASAGTMKVRSTPLLRLNLKEELEKYEEVGFPLVFLTEKVKPLFTVRQRLKNNI